MRGKVKKLAIDKGVGLAELIEELITKELRNRGII